MFDIVDWLDGLLGMATQGPMHRFTVAIGFGYTGMDVEAILQQYHIRIWGRDMGNDKEFGFLVKQSQALWAEYILCRAGVPLTSKLLDDRHYGIGNGTLPPAWGTGDHAHSFVDHVTVALDNLLGSPGVRQKRIKSQMQNPQLGKTYR